MKKLALLLVAFMDLCSFQNEPFKTFRFTKAFTLQIWELRYQTADTVFAPRTETITYYVWIKGVKTAVAVGHNGIIIPSHKDYARLIQSKSIW